MLKLLRHKGIMKKVLWVLAIVIIISFGFFGTANYLNFSRKVNYAGKIFGKKVSFKEFEASLFHARNQAILRYGQNFYNIREQLDLESEAWDRLILLFEAKKRKIKVSDEETVATIADMDFFKRDGKFSQELYERILHYVFRCRPRDFEEGVRESLIFQKLFEQETAGINITESELLKAYQEKNEKAQVRYVLFSPESYKEKIDIAEEEAKNHYLKNKNSFRMPPMINFEYLSMEFSEEADDKQKNEISNKMFSIADELSEGADFKEISAKYNLPIKESGFFSREKPQLQLGFSYQLLLKAFELKEGEFSDPIETNKGYYILRLKEKQDARTPEFDEIKDQVKDSLKAVKAEELAKEDSKIYEEKIRESLQKSDKANFETAAKNLGLASEQTPLFSRGQYIPKIGLAKKFQETAFSLKGQKEISPAVKTPKGFCILSLEKIVPIDKEKFEKERKEFRENLLTELRSNAFSEFIIKLRFKARLEDNISRLKEQAEQNKK